MNISRTQQILSTVVLSALFLPMMVQLPVWCTTAITSSLFWDLSYWIPVWGVGPVLATVGMIGFAIPCGVFAWVITMIWRN